MPHKEPIFILGNFNAHVENGVQVWPNVVYNHGLKGVNIYMKQPVSVSMHYIMIRWI